MIIDAIRKALNIGSKEESSNRTNHITDAPVNVIKSYYKKSKKGNHRFYIWVLVCKEGIIHTRMPSHFKPPKNAEVLTKYLKGHRPRIVK